jgi:hypothetical protein
VLKSRYIYRFVGYRVKLQMRGEGEAASRVVSGPDPDRVRVDFDVSKRYWCICGINSLILIVVM